MDKFQDRLGRYEILAQVTGLDRIIEECREGKGRRGDEGGNPPARDEAGTLVAPVPVATFVATPLECKPGDIVRPRYRCRSCGEVHYGPVNVVVREGDTPGSLLSVLAGISEEFAYSKPEVQPSAVIIHLCPGNVRGLADFAGLEFP